MEVAERLGPQDWMTAASSQDVIRALTRDGDRAMFVGGCVRDAILGRPVKDIDIATELPPERVIETLEAAGIHTVPTGLTHGTVTAVVPGAGWDHFEITTLRVDVETYGRRAQVAFTDDWEVDAQRRDFTLNAIFCDSQGQVFDPAGGLADLHAGRVRFVGKPAERIREDVLRILRFFRLHAYYGKGGPDPDALRACTDLADLLPSLSGERVAGEVLRTLSAPDPAAVFDLMASAGVLPVILPDATVVGRLRALVRIEASLAESLPAEGAGLRRLAALVATDDTGMDAVADRLRLSNRERARLHTINTRPPWLGRGTAEIKLKELLYRLGVEGYVDAVLLAWAEDLVERGSLADRGSKEDAAWVAAVALPRRWKAPVYPVQGRDVLALGVAAGPEVGEILAAGEAWWVRAAFAPDRTACLAWLKERIALP